MPVSPANFPPPTQPPTHPPSESYNPLMIMFILILNQRVDFTFVLQNRVVLIVVNDIYRRPLTAPPAPAGPQSETGDGRPSLGTIRATHRPVIWFHICAIDDAALPFQLLNLNHNQFQRPLDSINYLYIYMSIGIGG